MNLVITKLKSKLSKENKLNKKLLVSAIEKLGDLLEPIEMVAKEIRKFSCKDKVMVQDCSKYITGRDIHLDYHFHFDGILASYHMFEISYNRIQNEIYKLLNKGGIIVKFDPSCPVCDGKGLIPEKGFIDSNGEGKRLCPNCLGSGWIDIR